MAPYPPHDDVNDCKGWATTAVTTEGGTFTWNPSISPIGGDVSMMYVHEGTIDNTNSALITGIPMQPGDAITFNSPPTPVSLEWIFINGSIGMGLLGLLAWYVYF